ncbi:hypothetical protein AB0O91_20950 [Kitasatospora sp. NPDC089797]|uniref:hypothetical protein n=1 Tax=Kitasatospora sp. NPDC089797 TaxID=3155298 RepID=UPI00342A1BF4
MSALVTPRQIRAAFANRSTIDRGDDLAPVTYDDIATLLGEFDADDFGDYSNADWQVIADQLNSDIPGEPADSAQAVALQQVEEARQYRDRVVAQATEELADSIRHALAVKAPVTSIAARADLSRERIYQIRDGRR